MHFLNAGRQVITGAKDLIDFGRIFYTRLNNSRSPLKVQDSQFSDQFFGFCPWLDIAQRTILARPLDIDELRTALKSCKDLATGLYGNSLLFLESLLRPFIDSSHGVLELLS